jgi:hypothetical protein
MRRIGIARWKFVAAGDLLSVIGNMSLSSSGGVGAVDERNMAVRRAGYLKEALIYP